MRSTFTPHLTESIFSELKKTNSVFSQNYPGEPILRQPVHTVYGGAHLFKSGTAQKIGKIGLGALEKYGCGVEFTNVLGIRESLSSKVLDRVREKMTREPVEDFRIDFEDGYGHRLDSEEDEHAEGAAREVAIGMKQGTLPPFIGIRIKTLSEELKARSIRTLDIFMTTLAEETGGKLPDNFVVTLPKVTHSGQVTALVELFKILEAKTSFAENSLKMEIMVETTQSLIDSQGQTTLPKLVAASEGRCISAHFGTYDYTASCNITAAYQSMTHPSCDFAKHVMQVSLASTGLMLSDGATTVMPIGPHKSPKGGKPLTEEQECENRAAVHSAWKLHSQNIRHSLESGYYQGWDLHPAQIPVRYATYFAFFLEGLESASSRLKTFIDKAAQATLVGNTFDDMATGQGLLNYFLRAKNCGAVTETELKEVGLTQEELSTKSFLKIVNSRRS